MPRAHCKAVTIACTCYNNVWLQGILGHAVLKRASKGCRLTFRGNYLPGRLDQQQSPWGSLSQRCFLVQCSPSPHHDKQKEVGNHKSSRLSLNLFHVAPSVCR